MNGDTANLSSLIDGATAESGIDCGTSLLGFVDAVVNRDQTAIISARTAVTQALGEPAMIDSAAVIANFQRMVRIADSTGIPLDEPIVMMTQDIREELGIDGFAAAKNTPALGWLKGVIGRMLGPFAPRLLKRIAQKQETPS